MTLNTDDLLANHVKHKGEKCRDGMLMGSEVSEDSYHSQIKKITRIKKNTNRYKSIVDNLCLNVATVAQFTISYYVQCLFVLTQSRSPQKWPVMCPCSHVFCKSLFTILMVAQQQ